MATSKKVLPKQATLDSIRTASAVPAKAEVRSKKGIFEFPKFDLGDGSEKAREVVYYYGPLLCRLSNVELLEELGYWGYRFRKEFEVVPDKPVDNFLAYHKSLLRKIREGRESPQISFERRLAVRRACMALRWPLVPRSNFWGRVPSIPEVDSPRTDHRDLFLGKVSNWKLAQTLASRVGSCELAPHEFKFIWESWESARDAGPEGFEFRSPGYRDWAEGLYRSILDRDYCICYTHIQEFKRLAGCLGQVPLWKKPEVQSIFPEFGGGHVRLKPEQMEGQEEKSYRSVHPQQADLLAVLELEYTVVGGAEQLLLPHTDARPDWDGGGVQRDLF